MNSGCCRSLSPSRAPPPPGARTSEIRHEDGKKAMYLVAGNHNRVVDHGTVPQVRCMAQSVRPVGTEGAEAGRLAGGHDHEPTAVEGWEDEMSRAGEREKRAIS